MDWSFALIVLALAAGVFLLKRMGLVSPQVARSYLKDGALVVDVRSAGEFKSRHLPGALNLPLDELSDRVARRVPNKNQVLLLHCLSGTRSGIAKRMLRSMGYGSVFNLGSFGRAQRIVRGAGKES